ncbi:hypothetical protein HS99_0006295 [Kitasatospora aureofaciens]|uniref:Uncharacterized protein n=1 Tax=Kitasatospora aureofaciens TaxID=1894 RepID=A0A1E7N9R1_KITAU|nr:hypothetical protein HS99_0006295 [Kitasatospora aureofaciens]
MLQPAHDLAQRGGVEVVGEVADGLAVVVGEGVDAGAVEGGVEGLGCGAGEASVGEVGGLVGLVGGLAGTVGDVLPVVLTAQRVLEVIRPSTSTTSPRLRPGTFLPASSPVVVFGTPAAARTDWVSMITRDGSSNRLALSRTWQRSSSCIRWSRPSCRHSVK